MCLACVCATTMRVSGIGWPDAQASPRQPTVIPVCGELVGNHGPRRMNGLTLQFGVAA